MNATMATLPNTLPGIRHCGDGKVVAFCTDPTCRPAYDGPTCEVVDIPRSALALNARCWTCGDYLALSIRRSDIDLVVRVYDGMVRTNRAERAVVANVDNEACWEIVEVARDMNVLGSDWRSGVRSCQVLADADGRRLRTKISHGTETDDAEFQAVWNAALAYVSRLREELAGRPAEPSKTMQGLLDALARAAAKMGRGPLMGA